MVVPAKANLDIGLGAIQSREFPRSPRRAIDARPFSNRARGRIADGIHP